LTPAFEKGAAPVTCRGIKFYDKREQHVKRETLTGGTAANNIKFDLQPVATRILRPIAHKPHQGKTLLGQSKLGGVTTKQLALMPPQEGTSRMASKY